jgi:hypothetical protein
LPGFLPRRRSDPSQAMPLSQVTAIGRVTPGKGSEAASPSTAS